MNDSAPLVTVLTYEHVLHDRQEARFGFYLRFSDPDLISDEDLGLQQVGFDTEPDKPGGRIVFDSADYAIDEEAMKAMEALFLPEREEGDDELSAQD
jgi:hypothetical protein